MIQPRRMDTCLYGFTFRRAFVSSVACPITVATACQGAWLMGGMSFLFGVVRRAAPNKKLIPGLSKV